MIEIRQNQRKPYNWELAWPTNTAVVRQKGFVLNNIDGSRTVLPHK